MSTETIDPTNIPATLQKLAVPIDGLQHYGKNARKGDVGVIMDSLETHGQYRPVVVRAGTNEILAGNHTVKAARELGWKQVAATFVDVDDDEAARIVLVDNRANDLGGYDESALVELLQSLDGDLAGTGFIDDDVDELLGALSDPDREPLPGEEDGREGDGGREGYDSDDESGDWEGEGVKPGRGQTGSLAERFGAPPFTVLDTRLGGWQDRRRKWTAIGIESELGREAGMIFASPSTKFQNWYAVKDAAQQEAGRELSTEEVLASRYAADLVAFKDGKQTTSVFDPALCELLYRWHTQEGDAVLDPWAGGSVRGIVAGTLGRQYVGAELRPEQVEANRAQAGLVDALEGPEARVAPEWLEGDSVEVLQSLNQEFDFIIGCPPYYDLEKYSDDPRDLSNMSHADFDAQMHRNIAEAAELLRQDRFAAVVVGAVRDKRGHILDMRRLMVDAFAAAGMHLINDAVLINQAGAAAMRAGNFFQRARTLARTHQEVLVFVKGDRKAAARRLGDLDISATLTAADAAAEAAAEVTEGEGSEGAEQAAEGAVSEAS